MLPTLRQKQAKGWGNQSNHEHQVNMSFAERPLTRIESERKWRKINTRSIKGPLLLVAGICGGLGAAFNWDATPFAAGIAIILPVLGFRDFWKQTKFWITILILGLAQIPLMIAVRRILGAPKFPFLFALSVVDCFLVVATVLWICSSE
jgi:phage shock protein PspC (stress-responsive transcriptional regulator)